MFTNIINSLTDIKEQYFPNNQIEKDLVTIINRSEAFVEPVKLRNISKYTWDKSNCDIVLNWLKKHLVITQPFIILTNTLNLIEFLILNGTNNFVFGCKISLQPELLKLSGYNMYLDSNGVDKITSIRNKIDYILQLLTDTDLLNLEKEKINRLNRIYDQNYSTNSYYSKSSRYSDSDSDSYLKNNTHIQSYLPNINNKTEKKYNIVIKPLESNTNQNSISTKNNEHVDLIGLNDF